MSFHQIFAGLYEKAGRKMCRDCKNFIGKGAKILDLGCGSGIVGKTFQDFFQAELMGADIKDQRVVKIPFQIIDGRNTPFKDGSFDVVLINYVLHHVKEPTALLREAKRVANGKIIAPEGRYTNSRGGIIIIFEDLPQGLFANLICKIHGLSYDYFFQKDDQRGRFLNNESWKKMFGDLGLKLIFEKRVSHILNPVKKKLFVLEKV